jgi:hypothetical protein
MAENKGKPSGKVAENKKDIGKQSDTHPRGTIAGAWKKDTGKGMGTHAGGSSDSKHRNQ